jgi:hypothetical protein
LEIFASPEFRVLHETGDLKHIRNCEPFLRATSPMGISAPRNTIINPAAQKLTGIQLDTIPTWSTQKDPISHGLAWANMIDFPKCYYEHVTHSHFPKGKGPLFLKGILTNTNGNYLALGAGRIKYFEE